MKIGDRVRIKQNAVVCGHEWMLGKTGVIVKHDLYFDWFVKFDESLEKYYKVYRFNEPELELIEEKKFDYAYYKSMITPPMRDSFRYFTSIPSGLSINKKGTMNTLSDRLKKALNKDLRALYKLNWIDEDLELTEEGADELLELLLDSNLEAMGERARKEIKKREE